MQMTSGVCNLGHRLIKVVVFVASLYIKLVVKFNLWDNAITSQFMEEERSGRGGMGDGTM